MLINNSWLDTDLLFTSNVLTSCYLFSDDIEHPKWYLQVTVKPVFLKTFRAWSDAYEVFNICIIQMKNKLMWFKCIHLQMSCFFLQIPCSIWRMWHYPSSHFCLRISKGNYWHLLQYLVSKMFARVGQEKSPKELKFPRGRTNCHYSCIVLIVIWNDRRYNLYQPKMRQVSTVVCFSRKLLQKQPSRCVLEKVS